MTEFGTVRDFLIARKQAYVGVFKGANSEMVLEDLSRFCRAEESTFHTDPRIEGIMQGRREVWLRISKHLTLAPDELVLHFNPTGDTSND